MRSVWIGYCLAVAAFGAASIFLHEPRQADAQQPSATVITAVAIATGNTFQQALPSAVRRALTIQNNNTNGDNCWVFLGPVASATKATSILLQPGGSYARYYPLVPSDVVAVTCLTTADTMYVETQNN